MAYLNTRNLENELYDLQSRSDTENEERTEYEEIGDRSEPFSASDPLDDDECERLAALTALKDEFGWCEWRDGITLIPEDEFEDYAREVAEENEDIPQRLISYIDWSKYAAYLQMDCNVVEFDDETYYYR